MTCASHVVTPDLHSISSWQLC